MRKNWTGARPSLRIYPRGRRGPADWLGRGRMGLESKSARAAGWWIRIRPTLLVTAKRAGHATQAFVLAVLARGGIDDVTGEFGVSLRGLGSFGLSKDTVIRGIKAAIGIGLIELIRRAGPRDHESIYRFSPTFWVAPKRSRSVENRSALLTGSAVHGTGGRNTATAEVAEVRPRERTPNTRGRDALKALKSELATGSEMSNTHERCTATSSADAESTRSAPSARPQVGAAVGASGATELNGSVKHANGRSDARNARAPRAPQDELNSLGRGDSVRSHAQDVLRRAGEFISQADRIREQRGIGPRWADLYVTETILGFAIQLASKADGLTRLEDTFARFMEQVNREINLCTKKAIRDGSKYFVWMLQSELGTKPNAHRVPKRRTVRAES